MDTIPFYVQNISGEDQGQPQEPSEADSVAGEKIPERESVATLASGTSPFFVQTLGDQNPTQVNATNKPVSHIVNNTGTAGIESVSLQGVADASPVTKKSDQIEDEIRQKFSKNETVESII